MPISYTGKVAVITGASSGIGRALAGELAKQRCHVGLVARRRDLLASLVAEFRDAGGRATFACADVADRSQTVSAIREIAAELGPVDLLIANAGVGMPTKINPLNVADTEKMFRVNLLGVVYAIEAVLPEMIRRQSGQLAAISSLAAYKGMPGESGYCGSKAAVNVYMESLRIQLRPHHISVTTICPGFIKTPMTAVNQFPMPWLMEADKAARLIVRALARRRKVYNFPWQTTFLMKLTRWLPDWLLARALNGYEKPA